MQEFCAVTSRKFAITPDLRKNGATSTSSLLGELCERFFKLGLCTSLRIGGVIIGCNVQLADSHSSSILVDMTSWRRSGRSSGLPLSFESFSNEYEDGGQGVVIHVLEPAQRQSKNGYPKKRGGGEKKVPRRDWRIDTLGNLSLRLQAHCRKATFPAKISV